MNGIGRQVEEHWRRWLPMRYSRLQDPRSFFEGVGQEAQERIEELAVELAGIDPPGETYMEKVGRLQMARMQATEVVLAEVLPEPEPSHAVSDPATQQLTEPIPPTELAATSGTSEWIPLQEDPDHPFWKGQDREQT
ncbi:MAG: hypothetical protein H0X35_00505 [Pseudonocardiales bacterium]|nr:hypothetical protein [Pseudonocardiales bacterium]